MLKFSGITIGFPEKYNTLLFIVVPLLILGGFLGSNLLTKAKFFRANDNDNLNRKLIKFKSTFILKLALIEVPSFISTITFLITANYFFLGLVVLILLLFISKKPSAYNISTEANLSKENAEILNDPDAIVGEFEISAD